MRVRQSARGSTLWKILEDPGFGQRAVLVAKVGAHIDGLLARRSDVEQRAPALPLIDDRMRIGVRHLASRCRHHDLDAVVAPEPLKRAALEVDDELADALRPLLARAAAHPGPRCRRAAQRI